MDLTTIVFYVFAIITVSAAVVVVFSKNIVYSAFALLFAFFGVAGLYALMMADFLAITQLLIYVGGILVLVLFGVMLTSNVLDVQIRSSSMHILPGLLIVGSLAAVLGSSRSVAAAGTAAAVGTSWWERAANRCHPVRRLFAGVDSSWWAVALRGTRRTRIWADADERWLRSGATFGRGASTNRSSRARVREAERADAGPAGDPE